MREKIRLAFIYQQSDAFYLGRHVDNTLYHFYFDALKRSPELEVRFFPYIGTFQVLLRTRGGGLCFLCCCIPCGIVSCRVAVPIGIPLLYRPMPARTLYCSHLSSLQE